MDGDDKTVVRHLFFNSKGEATEEERDGKKLIWKDILREGHFAMTPGLGNRREPFDVVKSGASSVKDRRISLESLVRSFKDKAVEHVTLPLKHRDEEIDNTGFVEDLRIVDKKGKAYLQGACGFTEPDIAGKVRRGTIPNVSSGILFDFTRKADGKEFDSVLYHVKLTKSPWITDLEPFARVLAADDMFDGDVEIQAFQLADGEEEDNSGDDTGKSATIAWDETQGMNWVRNQISTALRPEPVPDGADDGRPMQPRAWYYVDDVSEKLALVTEEFKGTVSKLLIPWSRKDDGSGIDLAPQVRWQTVKEAFIAASDDDYKLASADTLREKITAELSDRFGDEAKGITVEGVAVNNIVKLRQKGGEAWLARYFLSDERVHIAPSPTWEKVEDAPSPKKAPPTIAKVVAMSDDPVSAARRAVIERNKRLLATNGHH